MLFPLPFVTLALALAAFGAPVKRDAEKVESDIQGVHTQSVALDNAVEAFPNSGGTFDQAIETDGAAKQLSDSVKAATSDVNASPNFTSEQSETIIGLVNNIVPIVQSGSKDLVAKKSALDAAGARLVAESDLKTLKTDVDAFWAALSTKLTPDTQADGQKALDAVDSALESAIDAYTT